MSPTESRPASGSHEPHDPSESCLACEALVRDELAAELESLDRSGRLPFDLTALAAAAPESAPGAPGGPVGAVPGLNVLAGLLAGPIARRILAPIVDQVETIAVKFAVQNVGRIFKRSDPADLEADLRELFGLVRGALTGSGPQPA